MNNTTLEWAAQWIEDSLTGETNERVIEFGRNMAMTLRAATQDAKSAEGGNNNNVTVESSCPHLHQDFPGTEVNKCLDCGSSLSSPSKSESRDDRSSVPLPSDVQKRIAEIRERGERRRFEVASYSRLQDSRQALQDIDTLLSITTADNGYVRGLEQGAKVCDQHQTNMALHSEPALAEQSRQDAQVIRALISQQEVKEP